MATSDPPPPGPATDDTIPPDPSRIGPGSLFIAFSRLALSGFGGVLPFAYRALVEQRKWLDAREFAGLLAVAQVMPGPTICNLSVMIGQRYAGFAGAAAALAGMVLGPSCIVIALGIAWQHYGEIPGVKRALGGMSAVAIGLIFATAVKMGINLFKPAAGDDGPRVGYWSLQRAAQIGLCVAGFAGVGLLRWPRSRSRCRGSWTVRRRFGASRWTTRSAKARCGC
jgi:chromate transporter